MILFGYRTCFYAVAEFAGLFHLRDLTPCEGSGSRLIVSQRDNPHLQILIAVGPKKHHESLKFELFCF